MTFQPSLHYDSHPLKDLLSYIDLCTIQGCGGGQYVRKHMLRQWWESAPYSGARPGDRHIDSILESVYRHVTTVLPPIRADEICRDKNSCAIVFSILLKIGGIEAGKYIHEYENNGIFDDLLPVALHDLKTRGLPYAEEFNQAQWAFSPPDFYLHRHRIYPAGTILPICMIEPINPGKGGTANLWQIAVQEEFVTPELRKKVKTCRFKHPVFGPCYQFALKKFKEGNAQFFKNEKEAFNALRGKEGMIQYLGDYEQKETETIPGHPAKPIVTHNIILEYAELDLDAYFHETRPPILEGEVARFWEDMFDVAGAVAKIHDLTVTRGSNEHKFYGWHADIKPDNILIVQGKFKLADPGFARFEKQAVGDLTTIFGGTTTYAAPECYRAKLNPRLSGTQVQRTIDIWSLGCVYSIAATWVVLGPDGIRQFRAFRDAAVQRAMNRQNAHQNGASNHLILTRGDYFHNGYDVLEDIRDWHRFLKRFLREGDTLTSQVLDLVDSGMLKGDPNTRTQAMDLRNKLQYLLESYRSKPRAPLPGTIMQALLRMDEEAPQRPEPSQILQEEPPDQPRRRRPSQLEPLKKTTHRSEFLRSEMHEQGVALEPNADGVHLGAINESMQNGRGVLGQDIQGDPWLSQQRLTDYSMQPWASRQPTFPLQRNRTGLSPPKEPRKPQNVFQARADMEKQRPTFGFGSKKDGFLTKFFSNRDIVFLVDNAGSMTDEWPETTYLLETLAMKLKGQDKNGMDLYFTNGDEKIEGSKDPGDFRKRMNKQAVQPMQGVNTDLCRSLGRILRKYLEELRLYMNKQVALHKIKSLTVIVLTDGKWDGEQVFDLIKDFCRDMQHCLNKAILGMENKLEKRERRVSIEFVQLGNDEDATAKLRRLDNDLPYAGADDIVDTEPSNGDLNKMILGSFNEEFDSRDDNPGSSDNFSVLNRPTSMMMMPESSGRATSPPDMSQLSVANQTYQQIPQVQILRADTFQTQGTGQAWAAHHHHLPVRHR